MYAKYFLIPLYDPCSHRYSYQNKGKFRSVSAFASLPFFSSGRVDSITLPRFQRHPLYVEESPCSLHEAVCVVILPTFISLTLLDTISFTERKWNYAPWTTPDAAMLPLTWLNIVSAWKCLVLKSHYVYFFVLLSFMSKLFVLLLERRCDQAFVS